MWFGLGLTFLIVALWTVGLRWAWERYDGRGGYRFWWLGVDAGRAGIGISDWDGFNSPAEVEWVLTRRGGPMRWWFEAERFSGSRLLWVPLWAPFLLIAPPTALAVWREWPRRRRPGACTSCGYSLAGLEAGSRCPECGTG